MFKFLMPYLANLISSNQLLAFKRGFYQLKRRIFHRPHNVDVFINICDPYSFLLVQSLPQLVTRYPIELTFYTVLDVQKDMYPEWQKWQTYSLSDATELAKLYEINVPNRQVLLSRSHQDIEQASWYLASIEREPDALRLINQVFECFWLKSKPLKRFTHSSQSSQLVANEQRLKKKGHYLSATLFYAGEWFWGLDRLYHLEMYLGQQFASQRPLLFNRQNESVCVSTNEGVKGHVLEMYFSARSPYSYLGLLRVIKFCQFHQLTLDVKPVLPMVMRGLAVPQNKKMYIFHDTKREANFLNIPYGKVADPLGKAVENCYCLFYYAKSQHKEIEFLLAFSRAVNSQGIHADSLKGLELIVKDVGLCWQKAQIALDQQHWRNQVENNMQHLAELGFWGVPCFKFRDTVVWGQDRLWLIEKQLLKIT